MRSIGTRRLVELLATLLLVLPPTARAQEADWTIERIAVKHRFASELEGPARAALSASGTVVVDEASNSLIVRDTKAGVAALRALVASLDATPRRLTVRVRTVSRMELERAASTLQGGVSTGTVSVGAPPPTHPGIAVGIILAREVAHASGSTRQSITVQSGQEAEVSVGGTQPLAASSGRNPRDLVYRDFGSTLRVKPTLLGDGQVRVEVSPRTSGPVDRRTGIGPSSGLDTVVVLHPGDALVIGGVGRQGETGSRSWPASWSSATGSDSLVYLLDVTADPTEPERPTPTSDRTP